MKWVEMTCTNHDCGMCRFQHIFVVLMGAILFFGAIGDAIKHNEGVWWGVVIGVPLFALMEYLAYSKIRDHRITRFFNRSFFVTILFSIATALLRSFVPLYIIVLMVCLLEIGICVTVLSGLWCLWTRFNFVEELQVKEKANE